MDKIKVMTVFGTRPEAIKMAPLVKELESREEIQSIVAVTAQHRQMLDQVLEIFKITPDYDLDIMKERQTLVDITSNVLKGLYDVIGEAKPDIVLVHGDTTTTFAGALAAFYRQVAVGHIEAGLRTYDKYSPFPEEMNRVLTGSLTELHFSPTIQNKKNLLKENKEESKIFITGNTVIDALKTTVRKDYEFANETLKNLDFSKKIIVVTAHRRENLGEPLHNICNAIKRLAVEFQDEVQVVYPVHLNPAVREVAFSILGDLPNVKLIDPVDVCELHNLMDRSYMIMTDSGGLQEEAPSLGKPVLVLRNETERPEAVEAGTVKIAGVDEDVIYEMGKTLLTNQAEYDKMAKAVNPYGDGLASKRSVDAILYHFGVKKERPADLITNV
ncbi:MAG: UDP-N-acetylglucosamine 2-epimerase (non-hydrolyzing) [Clostridia bacterium]|nr:UDP-N-acetylglucosamine 2-epimerase (non-hydrolyzing) [Clostridia bacterium]